MLGQTFTSDYYLLGKSQRLNLLVRYAIGLFACVFCIKVKIL